jgi:hypothetical protein
MLFVGFLVPVPIAWWLIAKTRADIPLTLIGLTSLPLLVWSASLGAKVGPCDVPDCISSTQHSHLVVSIAGLVVVLAAFVVLSTGRRMAGGLLLTAGQLVGAYSMLKTDRASAITFLILGLAAASYLFVQYRLAHEARGVVPDFPPAA